MIWASSSADEAVEPQLLLGQHQPLEGVVGRVQDHRRGRLVDLAALDADEAVLDVVDPADAVRAAQVVQPLDQLDAAQRLAVDRDRDAALEADHDRRPARARRRA